MDKIRSFFSADFFRGVGRSCDLFPDPIVLVDAETMIRKSYEDVGASMYSVIARIDSLPNNGINHGQKETIPAE